MKTSTRRDLLLALLITLFTLLSYGPAVTKGGFVWDDDDYVTENELLEAEDGLARIWFEPSASPQYYPLVFTSFRIERAIGGESAFLHHLTNVLLHAANALLVFFLARRMKLDCALILALLFALHPVHTESVAWITERKNVLSGLFYLLALRAYIVSRSAEGSFSRAYASSLVYFVLALFSKTVTCSLGPVLLLWHWWRKGKIERRDWLEAVPFFVLGLLGAAMTASTEVAHVGAQGAEWDFSFAERLQMAGRALVFYVGKLLLPIGLSFNYAPYTLDAGSLLAWLFPLLVILLLLALVAPPLVARIGRDPAAALLFFAGSVFPALGFFNIYPMRYYFVADHYQYLASLGPLALVAALLGRLPRRPGQLAVGLVAILLGILTFVRCGIYESPETLWRDTLAKNDRSWLALNNLAMMSFSEGRADEARRLMARAIEVAGEKKEVLNNAGKLSAVLDQDQEKAIRYFEQALVQDPRYLDARSNLALMLARTGRNEEAVLACDQALEDARILGKSYPQAHFVKARALFNLRRYREALTEVEEARRYLGSPADLMALKGEIEAELRK